MLFLRVLLLSLSYLALKKDSHSTRITRIAKENCDCNKRKCGTKGAENKTEPSVTDDDITNYLNQVINEVKEKKGRYRR